jgi:DNA-binding MarR family transcriptional regulator
LGALTRLEVGAAVGVEVVQELLAQRRFQSSVDDFDEAAAAVLGVNRTDLRCLEILTQHDTVTPSVLGQALGLTTGSVTAMLDRLERMDYLTRSPDPSDRRKVAVRRTEEVERRVWELYGPVVHTGEEIMADYTAEQLEFLATFLRRAQEAHERHVARVRELPSAKRSRATPRRT